MSIKEKKIFVSDVAIYIHEWYINYKAPVTILNNQFLTNWSHISYPENTQNITYQH